MAVARRNRGLFAATPLALGALVLSGCTIAAHADAPASTFAVSTLDSALAPEDASSADAEATFANDEWDPDAAVTITLDGTTASADGAGVTIDGATVTITATGTYVLTGELRGQVIVAAPAGAVVALVLDGATISSDDAAATATAPVTPTDGTEDSVALVASAAAANALTGISSPDDLVVLSGTIDVTAVDDAIRGKDSLAIEGGTLVLDAGGGALAPTEIDAATGYVAITGGSITLAASDEGLRAATDVVVTGGAIVAGATGKGLTPGVYLVLEGDELDSTGSATASSGSYATPTQSPSRARVIAT